MPEIAEVETVKETLKKQILNKRIMNVEILYPKMIESDIKEFKQILVNNSFIDIKRIGKWLLFELNEHYLLSHLRMEGKFFIKRINEPIIKHEHLIFTFEDKTDLRYHDTRKFGRMNLIKKHELSNVKAIAKQGIEPLSEKLTSTYLLKKFKNRKLSIKTLLMDQTIISGLGNIYVNEVLFAAKINPLKIGNEITLEECNKIIHSSKDIIAKAIQLGGTTIKSYTSSLGVTGKFQSELKVHKRENKECFVCGQIIKRIKINGRSTYYCERCQSCQS